MAVSTALWLASAPLLVAAFVALVVVAVLARDNLTLTVVLGVAALLALLLRLRMRAAGARARILSGNTPFGCFHAPTTPDDFAQRLHEVWRATGRRPTVVGSGWGFFIGRAHARDAVFTHRLKGRFGEAFLAGTELREVEAALRKAHGRTFWSTPTMQRISIGSWLARSCHGNSGAAGKPSSYAAARVYVIDMDSRATTAMGPYWAEYKTAKLQFDADPERYAIVAVQFDVARMAENKWLQKRKVEVPVQDHVPHIDLLEWLKLG